MLACIIVLSIQLTLAAATLAHQIIQARRVAPSSENDQ